MSDEEFVEFCAQYPDYLIEVSAEGDMFIMPPSDFLTSAQIGEIYWQLSLWSRAGSRGWVTESSGGYVLPNGARRAADVAWFPGNRPGIPDRKKLTRLSSGERSSITKSGAKYCEPESLINTESIAGEEPVEGFVLDLRPVWDPARPEAGA